MPQLITRCSDQVGALTEVYDGVYGRGQTDAFLNGDYARDLPRAVLRRVEKTLKTKATLIARADDERAAQEARDREAQAAKQARDRVAEQARAQERERKDEADRQQELALSQQRASEAKAKADEASAHARAAAESAEAERLKQIETAKGAAKLLVTSALHCGHEQLKSLVKSGESSEVLASAVMTICGADVDHFVEAGIGEYRLEQQSLAFDEGVARAKLREEMREHIVALAVQAKAGVGDFAASSSN
ncbi:hypothetical protein [Beijerinckia sp. L45]|uniref:hypothetical protein n=1 Tax=Beijerinckia sp. L45 TaxID=1641855 RepID=UPI00131D455B|nr:hypothetical protein [Beijerinckia sp. L45]